jgi:hypothetical protein
MKRFNLDVAVKIAALVEALVVVVSALFIAAQQHLQSQELSAQTAINATQLATQRVFQLQSTPEFDRVLQQGFADYASLSEFDRMRYRRYVLSNLFVGEDFYYQHVEGLMGDDVWENWRRGLARYRGELEKPQWRGWQQYFSLRYADFLEKLPPQPPVGF